MKRESGINRKSENPYVMKRSDFSAGLKDLPAIEVVDVTNYLVIQTSFTLETK